MAVLAERVTAADPSGPEARQSTSGLAHVPALDGLRGLAVLGVLAFHVGWIDGGYLGVDAFFVLSGFLITSLLLAEHRGTGRVDLRRFWGRRARRLLPAMLVMVAVVLVWGMLSEAGQLAALRGDAVATVLYVANWHEIAQSQDYWSIFAAPSPLQHTWSLAIEEQFYLVWPLVVVGLAWLARRSRRSLAAVVAGASILAAIASAALMASLYRADDISRAYYGTGSRIGAIAIGAALAAVLATRRTRQPGDPARTTGGHRSQLLQVAAIPAAVGLAFAWWTVGGTSAWLYRGGFSVLGIAVAVVIAAVLQPGSPLGRMVAWRPLRAVGLVSYGLYLWHWVVIAVLTEDRTGLHGLGLDLAQLTLSVVAALVSYWCLEQPIRLRRWLGRPAPAVGAAIAAYAGVFGLVALSTLVTAPGLGALDRAVEERASTTTLVPGTAAIAANPTTASAPAPNAPPPTAPPATAAPLPPATIGVFGDSTAISTGFGLTEYGRRTGAFQVAVNDGRIGCGVDQGGERRFRGEVFVLAEFCGDLGAHWTNAVAAQQIDVAVIQTGMWEIVERRLDGDVSWRQIGDPAIDAAVAAELDAANAFWAARGVGVVWLRAPTPTFVERAPEAMARFNDLVEQSAARFPTATTVGLDEFLDGFTASERQQLRPDGIHFTLETGTLVADRWLGAQVTEAIDRVRQPPR